MAERAGKGPQAAWSAIHAAMPQAKLSGIVGDRNHKYGYDRGRSFIGNDYSTQAADDKAGPGEAASALDVTLSTADMKAVTTRLIKAVDANDSRLHCLREFFGTTNGSSVTGRDVRSKRWVSSDSSHLWHVHLSFYRKWADSAECKKVAEVFTGKGSAGGGGTTPPKPPPSNKNRPWPKYMPAGHYFGLISGPAKSHGGHYDQEKPDVKAIQQKLQALKFAPAGAGWADGKFEKPTADAVTKFQRKHMPGTKYYGQVWSDDWRKLFSL